MTNQPTYAVIVAGGSGLRMGTDIPKQFLEIGGLPVLMRTLLRFSEADTATKLILVLPASQQVYWKELCTKYTFQLPHTIVDGGNSRFQSVKNGLNAIKGTVGLVAIHDGVRPFVSKEIILKSFETASVRGNATVAVASKDSLRVVEGANNRAVERSAFRIIQTPQTFQVALIKQAFETPELPLFTDDASVFEHAGHRIELIEGSYDNIKITTPEDLIFANELIKKN